jgi:hypothetical protein
MEVSGQLHAPAALILVPIRLEGEWAPVSLNAVKERENCIDGSRTQAVQPLAHRYLFGALLWITSICKYGYYF